MPGTQLCVTVTAPTTAELRRQRDAVTAADLVELRLDGVADPDVSGALAGRRTPVIVTVRPRWEGGAFDGSEEERRRLLGEALALGAEYVDVEWRAGFDDILRRTGGRRVVLSMHDFAGIPSDVASQLRAMRATGAEVVKVAVTPRCLAQTAMLRDLSVGAADGGKVAVVGMGDYGIASRVLAALFKSAWTYAGARREIGQIDATAMTEFFRFRSITGATAVYGIVGGSVAHSVSPAIHNAAFRAVGVDAVYLPMPAVSADDFVRFGRAIGVAGASVTIPHKVALAEHVDELSDAARRIGAINTIRVDGGRWIGANTDASGFLAPLQERVRPAGLRASVLGAGGAARAVAVALTSARAVVTLHARDVLRAQRVAADTGAQAAGWPPQPGTWDLLVNATPVGMLPHDDQTPIPKAQLTGGWVYDLIYNPPKTRLLREAAEMGCQTLGGLDMLVAQAQEQFQWWTGQPAPVDVMRDAALKRVAEFSHHEDHVV